MICVNAEVDPEEFIVLPEWQNKVIRINLTHSPENMMDIVVTVTEQAQDQADNTSNEGQNSKQEFFPIQIKLFQENTESTNESQGVEVEDELDEDTVLDRSVRPICRRRRSRSRSDPSINPEELNLHRLSSISPELLKPCEYYRKKYFHHFNDDCPHCWTGLSTLQKSAGQKVIEKISAESKVLEAELGRKCSLKSSQEQSFSNLQTAQQFPPKRKPIKLEPLPLHAN